MRQLSVLLFLAAAACGNDHAEGESPDAPAGGEIDAAPTDVDLPVPVDGWQVKSPNITLAPGQEATYCYYFHTPNAAQTVVKSWQSHMTPGSHHMILYLSGTAQMPDGTLDATGNCGGAGGGAQDIPVWTYLTQTVDNESDMPADDGAGKPVGMPIAANQPAVMQMHYLNTTDNPLVVHVTLNANAYADGTDYTPAAAFVTYNTRIDIPAGVGQTASAQGQCAVPAGAKFFTVSTHAHKQSVETTVADGAAMLVDSTDWEHPTVKTWPLPFYSFASGKIGYQCNYVNQGNAEIHTGPSAQTDEMCMAIGYFFPATKSKMCINSLVVN